MAHGDEFFIPSMRRECLIRLGDSMQSEENMRYIPKILYLLKEYEPNDLDIILLVDEEIKAVPDGAQPIDSQVKVDITRIFEEQIEISDTAMSRSGNTRPAILGSDRISLMSYSKNVCKMFNLTEVDENPVHLENQIERLRFKLEPEAQKSKDASSIQVSMGNTTVVSTIKDVLLKRV